MSSAEKAPQDRIGKYEILEKIGQGAMGVVYKARDPLMERVVAVKTMSTDLDAAPEMRARFFREARSAGQLSHKNIITIFELGEEERRAYMVMEYVEGEDLKTKIVRGDRLALEEKLRIMAELCEGLGHAHQKNVIHRDIKPGNVYVTSSGPVKILDFGLAHVASSDITKTGSVLGTPNYMSPEQVRGDKVDHRSDIFSAGALFYELLTGRKPFYAPTLHGTLFKILEEDPEPTESIDPTLPGELTSIVKRCLAKDPAERYQRVPDLLRDLERVKKALGERLTHLQDEAREAVSRLDLFVKEHETILKEERAQRSKADETVRGSSEFPADYQGIIEVRDRARREYEKLSVLAQRRTEAAVTLGEASRLEKKGDLEAAAALAARVLADLPYHAEADALQRRLTEAIARKTHEERTRREVAALMEDAKELLRQGALAESQARLDRALALVPDHAPATALHKKVAVLLEEQRRQEAAAAEKHRRAEEALAQARQADATGDLAAASDAARAALVERPGDAEARQILERAETLVRQKRQREEVERRAASLLTEAEKLAASGDYTAAASVLRRADQSVAGVSATLERYQEGARAQHEARRAEQRERQRRAPSAEETVIVPRAAPPPRAAPIESPAPAAPRAVAATPRSPSLLYAGLAAGLVVVLVGGWLVKRALAPTPPAPQVASQGEARPSSAPSLPVAPPTAAAPTPDAEVARGLAEARGFLESRRYEEAAKAARAVLERSPGDAEASSLERRARESLGAVAEGRRRAKSLLDAGKFEEATMALLEVLKLAPSDPEAQKLSVQLDRHARKQADEALAKVKDARTRAQQARPELAPDAFEAARRVDGDAARLYEGRQYSQAAAKLTEAAEAYARAETEARAEAEKQQRAEVERRIAAQRTPPPSPTEPPIDEAALRQADDARKALEAARRGLPADPRAAADEASAQDLYRQGKLAEAAAAFRRAAAPYEAARQDRRAIEGLLQRYKASMEARDLEALKAAWPSVDEKKVRQGFQIVKSWRIDLQITDLQVSGDAATATCERRDDMVTVDGNKVPRTSTARFSLRKKAGSWIIGGID